MSGEIILYQTEDGQTRVQCRFAEGTIWMTQVQIAELFQTSILNINIHLKTIYAEGELIDSATIKSYLTVRVEAEIADETDVMKQLEQVTIDTEEGRRSSRTRKGRGRK